MLRWLKRFFSSPLKRYEQDKEALSKQNEKERCLVATDTSTNKEILYYMADDLSDKVRVAVAGNKSTPLHVSPKLAQDKNVDVRLKLANRLVTLLPDLSKEEHAHLYAFAVQALGMLAEDESLKIRRALSTALKDITCSPPQIVSKLANDLEREIAEPLLKYCLRIPDDNLLDILEHHPAPWAASAIAERRNISQKVSAGIFKKKDISAGKLMLGNKGADISQETLEEIIDFAKEHSDWHEGIALRHDLTFELARKLVGFASKAVLMILEKRKDFDKRTRQDIVALIKRRIDFKDNALPNESVESHVERYYESGKLDMETLLDALAWQDFGFIMESLAQLSGFPKDKVDKIVKEKEAKTLVALIWKSKLPMRLAVELQQKMANIQPRNLVYARGGTDYPFSEEDMEKILTEEK